jgi:hypothetical protein
MNETMDPNSNRNLHFLVMTFYQRPHRVLLLCTSMADFAWSGDGSDFTRIL